MLYLRQHPQHNHVALLRRRPQQELDALETVLPLSAGAVGAGAAQDGGREEVVARRALQKHLVARAEQLGLGRSIYDNSAERLRLNSSMNIY